MRNSAGDVLHGWFAALGERNVRYCVLRNYESLPERVPGSDLDVLVHPDDSEHGELTLREIATACGWTLVSRYPKDYAIMHFRFWRLEEGTNHFLRFDLMTGVGWRGVPFLSTAEVLARRLAHRGLYVPRPVDEVVITVLTGLFYQGHIKQRYVPKWSATLREQRVEMEASLARVLGGQAAKRILAVDLAVARVPSVNRWRLLLLARGLRRQPLRQVRAWLGLARLAFSRALHPQGVLVALVGPDGGGKTTITGLIRERVSKVFPQVWYFHWRPGLLGDPWALLGGRRPQPAGKRRQTEHVTSSLRAHLSSLLRISYYVLDYVLGYFFRVLPIRIRGGLVLGDRYFYDYMVAPEGKRFTLGPGWARPFLWLVPAPDLVILCTGNASEIHRRKPELELAEIDRQLRAFQMLEGSIPRLVAVSTTEGSPAESCEVAIGHMAQALHAQVAPVGESS